MNGGLYYKYINYIITFKLKKSINFTNTLVILKLYYLKLISIVLKSVIDRQFMLG
jgi:hypothetical protein